jgi:hypothetical protein
MLRKGVADFGPYKKRLAKGKLLETDVVRKPVGVRETCSLETQRVSFVFLLYVKGGGGDVLSMVYLTFYKICFSGLVV